MRQTRFSRHFFRALLVLLLSAPLILLLLALQTQARIPVKTALDQAELAQVEQLLLDATPQSPTSASEHSLRLNHTELNLLLRYGLELLNLSPDWTGELTLADSALQSQLSIRLLDNDWSLYLNIDSHFQVEDNRLQLTELSLGQLQIPRPLLRFAVGHLLENFAASQIGFQDIQQLAANIDGIAVDPESVAIQLHWDPALANRITQQAQMLFISAEDQQRIGRYYEQISLLAATIPADLRAISLNSLLVPLFQTARERSRDGSDAVAENRTLLQTLAIYVNNEDIGQLIGADLASQLPPAKFVEVRLHRRQDLAQHVISIAAITASAGAGFAELLSNTKEAYDARYRSGFSFSDLTANSVGVLLATYATQDRNSALLMQERLANLTSETDYMPEVGNSRDGISESDFNALYENRNSPEYQARLNEIENLIAARPLFQNIP